MNRQQLQRIEHLADSTKLATLMRLARARKQVGWRYQRKTAEEWLQEAASLFGNDESGRRFHEISEVFEEIGIGAIPILIEALRHEEWRIRMSAASLLGMFGPDAITAVPALARALNDSKARVRRTVLKSLILIQEMPIFVLSPLLR
ncbi:MAG: HEAT repeat domain-containing protein, partial [Ktedonobacteraceae bacterium]|nr:HEAT repeat domain-containing protein [Ktedonobacteraceae bacterium]